MISRLAGRLLEQRLRTYPAVGLVGARQVGKTTLARSLSAAYFDLEQPGDRTRLDVEWDTLIAGERLIILDEAQAAPEIFPRLRGAIDQDRKRNGRFLLLGSVSPALMVQVSESLAGRLSMIELTPLLLEEIDATIPREHWLRGGYPDGGILGGTAFPRWQLDYLTLLAQRDLPSWGLPAKPQMIERLVRMTATVSGQIWNGSRLAASLGLSHPTVGSYLDYLEGAFLVRLLRPYAANVGKRLSRRPKLYWRDSGLLHALLRVSGMDDLLVQPWVGASWEGYVIEQILSRLATLDRRCEPYFVHTSDGYEIDLLLDWGSERWAIEVKLTSQPDPRDLERLNKVADLVGATTRILVSQTAQSAFGGRQISCDLPSLLRHLGS